MSSIEFEKMLKPYNGLYFDLFGYVPCRWNYKCTQDEYYAALLLAIKTKQDLSALLRKRVFDYSDSNVRY